MNRLISNGLLNPGALPDKGRSPQAPVETPAPRPSLLKPDAMAMSASPGPAGNTSVICRNVQMTGSIDTPEELHVYGTIKGDVRAASLVICKGGVVRGEIVAESVLVHGSVEGSIQAKKVHLLAEAIVRGDITHDVLSIDGGARFEGASKRLPEAATESPTYSEAA